MPTNPLPLCRSDRILLNAACEALRAWIKADNADLSLERHLELLREARRLTGYAVDEGLLRYQPPRRNGRPPARSKT